jgi:hypothetical protein
MVAHVAEIIVVAASIDQSSVHAAAPFRADVKT